MIAPLVYQSMQPDTACAMFVESFWLLENGSDIEQEVVVLPDGRIDLFFTQSASQPFHIVLMGLGTQPTKATILPRKKTFAISFRLLAAEYILERTLATLVDKGERQPDDFWNFNETVLSDFNEFCRQANEKIVSLIPCEVDNRKQTLFEQIHNANGNISVKELADNAYWSSRQINRYFKQQYGLALKTYCNILRFRASFQQIKQHQLFPEDHFADQSHFIKEIKRLAGVSPKDLSRNHNGRFIQLSTLPGA